MGVHRLEGAEQALAAFFIQAADSLTQPPDRLGQVVFFLVEGAALFLDRRELFVGPQVDRAEPFAVGAQRFEFCRDGRRARALLVGFDAGKGGKARGFAFEVGRGRLDHGFEAHARDLAARLAARLVFPGGAHGVQRGTGFAVRLGERGFASLASVGGLAQRGFGGFEIAEDRAARQDEAIRGIGQLIALADRGFQARFDIVAVGVSLLAPSLPGAPFGCDSRKASITRLPLFGEGLEGGPGFRLGRAMPRDPEPRSFEPGSEIARGLKRVERGLHFRVLFRRFVARGERVGLGGFQRCKSGAAFAAATFGGGMLGPGGIERAACGLLRLAGGTFSRRGFAESDLRRIRRIPERLRLFAGKRGIEAEIREAVALDEPARRGRRRFSRLGEPVPAPDVAFARDEPLAGLQTQAEDSALGAGYDSDLSERAPQRRGRLDEAEQRRGIARQQAIVGRRHLGPMRRCGRVDRGVEIVAERRAKRRLVAFRHFDRIGDGRPFRPTAGVEKLGERADFGFEALRRALGLSQRRAGGEFGITGGSVRPLGVMACGLRDVGGFRCDLELFRRSLQPVGLFEACLQRLARRTGGGDLAIEAGDPGGLVAQALGERSPPGFGIRALGLGFGEFALRLAAQHLRFGDRFAKVAFVLAVGAAGGHIRFLRVEAGQDAGGILQSCPIASEVAGHFGNAPLDLGEPALGAALLAFERFPRHDQPLQGRPGLNFAVAQSREAVRGDGLMARRLALAPRRLDDLCDVAFEFGARFGDLLKRRVVVDQDG